MRSPLSPLLASLVGALVVGTFAAVPSAEARSTEVASTGGVVLTGRLEALAGGGVCGATHQFDCTASLPGALDGIQVGSAGLDPFRYEGELFEFVLKADSTACGVYAIAEVHPPAGTLVQCGTPAPGCPFRLRVGPSGEIGQWTLWWSPTPGFFPLGDATLLLGAPQFLASGLLFGETATFDVSVPGDISTVGLPLWFQGTRQSIGPVGPLRLTNVECIRILSPTVPCFVPDC